MPKQVYIPDRNELYLMQDYGANVYKYLLIKAIETIIMEGTLYEKKGMLKNRYKYIQEDENIARGVCYLYPQEMIYSEIAKYDQDLCLALINKSNEKISLDDIGLFTPGILYSPYIIQNVTKKLEEGLAKNPQYRFEYIYPYSNKLLDDIFGCNMTKEKLIFPLNEETIKSLCNIEPAYILKYSKELSRILSLQKSLGDYLNETIEKYGKRYLIDPMVGTEYIGKDILTNPNQDVKRLVKCIKYK